MNVHVLGRWLAPGVLWLLVVGSLGLAMAARSEAVAAQAMQDHAARQTGVTPGEAATIATAGGVAEATIAAWVAAADAVPMSTAAVRVARGSGTWNVLVAATVALPVDPTSSAPASAPTQRFYVVSIDVATWTVVGSPAQVAAPRLDGPEVDVGGPLEDLPPDAADTITGFLDGLLAAGAAMDRYVTPDSPIQPIEPAPYDTVTVDGVLVHESDGTEATVTVHATGHADTTRSQPLQYVLRLRHDSRWEVVAIVNYPDKDTGT